MVNKGLDVWWADGVRTGDRELTEDAHEMGTIFCWEIDGLRTRPSEVQEFFMWENGLQTR